MSQALSTLIHYDAYSCILTEATSNGVVRPALVSE